jgi:hypothetical protein
MRRLTAVALLLMVAVGPAWAVGGPAPVVPNPAQPQPGESLGKVNSAQLVPEIYKLCREIATAAPSAAEETGAAGWVRDDSAEGSGDGPFFTQFAANKTFGGIGEAALWGTIEYYPSRRQGYCRIDFPDPGNIVNFDDFSKIPGVTGKTQAVDQDIYGAWQEGATDPSVLILAQRVGGDFQLEMNTQLPAAPAPGVKPAKPASTNSGASASITTRPADTSAAPQTETSK